MAAKKKKKSRSKRKPVIEASFRVNAGVKEEFEEKFKEWSASGLCQRGGCKLSGGVGWFYFLGWIGASVYYVQQAEGFWASLVGIVRALFWPAYLVYKWLG